MQYETALEVEELVKQVEEDVIYPREREAFWDYIFAKFPDASEEALNALLDRFIPAEKGFQEENCLMCETSLINGECPHGCTDDPGYGVMKGYYFGDILEGNGE